MTIPHCPSCASSEVLTVDVGYECFRCGFSAAADVWTRLAEAVAAKRAWDYLHRVAESIEIDSVNMDRRLDAERAKGGLQ